MANDWAVFICRRGKAENSTLKQFNVLFSTYYNLNFFSFSSTQTPDHFTGFRCRSGTYLVLA